MKRFEQFLAEITAGQPRPYQWHHKGDRFWDGSFCNSSGHCIIVEVYYSELSTPQREIWHLDFRYARATVQDLEAQRGGAYVDAHGAEGTGDAISVFTTVVTMLRDFLDEHPQPTLTVVFHANEPSRERLYDNFMGKVAAVLPGYKGKRTHAGSYEVSRI